MVARVSAAQAAVDRFNGQAFAWRTADCARLAAFTLQRLGYKPGFARFGHYSTATGAVRALRRNGFADTPDWLDSIHGLTRVAPAMALPGDILAMPGEDGLTSLAVALGGDRLLGLLRETGGFTVLQPLIHPNACWRAAPCS